MPKVKTKNGRLSIFSKFLFEARFRPFVSRGLFLLWGGGLEGKDGPDTIFEVIYIKGLLFSFSFRTYLFYDLPPPHTKKTKVRSCGADFQGARRALTLDFKGLFEIFCFEGNAFSRFSKKT